MDAENLNLIYISGVGRNGSTLLGRVLGEQPTCLFVGEALSYMLNSSLRKRHESITLDHSPNKSAFWNQVFSIAGFSSIEFNSQELLHDSNFDKLFSDTLNRRSLYEDLSQKIEIFLKAIREVSGKTVIIDSSKQPNIALLLKDNPNINVLVVHLVRDPIGVAGSRSVKKDYLKRENFMRMALRWKVKNENAMKLEKNLNYVLIDYKLFCQNPFDTVKALLNHVDQGLTVVDSLKDKVIALGNQPIVAGNPDKFVSGEIRISYKEPKVDFFKRCIVNLLTYKLRSKLFNNRS